MMGRLFHVLFVTSSLLILSISTYEYTSGYHRRSYRYVQPVPVQWTYTNSGGQDNYVTGRAVNGGGARFIPGPSPPEYQGGDGVVKNRRRNYADSSTAQQQYPSTLNELETTSGSRWYSHLKRKASLSPKTNVQLDAHNRVQMGVSNSLCDDAKSNLTVDWNLSPINYTCFHPETRFPRSFDAEPLLECDNLPPKYVPGHVCMDQEIDYTDPIPTHGDHRPLWPKFGEYMFVPRQRWLHNIEHGAVVMLYHPCAYPSEVNRLRTIVKGCVGKHVITPSTLLTPERPLALVAWGCRLLMSAVDDEMAMKFIQARAHKGPEGTYTKEGQYELWLLNEAKSSGAGAKYGYSKVSCDAIDRTAL